MSTCKIADNAWFQELDGEAVLLSLDEGCYYGGLDGPGTRIRRPIDDKPDQVVEKTVEEYDVEPGQAPQDFDAFIRDLRQSGLIHT